MSDLHTPASTEKLLSKEYFHSSLHDMTSGMTSIVDIEVM